MATTCSRLVELYRALLGNYLTIQFELDGEKHVAFTGSEVLSNQLERYKDKIPFRAKIIKQDKYFTFS